MKVLPPFDHCADCNHSVSEKEYNAEKLFVGHSLWCHHPDLPEPRVIRPKEQLFFTVIPGFCLLEDAPE